MQLLETLRELQHHRADRTHARDAMSQLNAELYDLTTLYERYAEPFALPECKLAIVACAGLNDQALVESLWTEIVNKGSHCNCIIITRP